MDRSSTAPLLSSRFTLALSLACELHATQTRKGSGVPYVAHLLAVASLALEHGATEDEAIAALLHDALEDQGGEATAARIERELGAEVLAIVRACSDTTEVPKPPWRERKERYLARLERAPSSVRLVSACDKLHNARSLLADYRVLGEELWGRFRGGREGTLWYYRAMLEAYAAHGSSPLVDELRRTVEAMEALAGAARP